MARGRRGARFTPHAARRTLHAALRAPHSARARVARPIPPQWAPSLSPGVAARASAKVSAARGEEGGALGHAPRAARGRTRLAALATRRERNTLLRHALVLHALVRPGGRVARAARGPARLAALATRRERHTLVRPGKGLRRPWRAGVEARGGCGARGVAARGGCGARGVRRAGVLRAGSAHPRVPPQARVGPARCARQGVRGERRSGERRGLRRGLLHAEGGVRCAGRCKYPSRPRPPDYPSRAARACVGGWGAPRRRRQSGPPRRRLRGGPARRRGRAGRGGRLSDRFNTRSRGGPARRRGRAGRGGRLSDRFNTRSKRTGGTTRSRR
jgi:hypothetical protein